MFNILKIIGKKVKEGFLMEMHQAENP